MGKWRLPLSSSCATFNAMWCGRWAKFPRSRTTVENNCPAPLSRGDTMLKVTVSGSFHRHLHAIASAVQELCDLGVRVLSPADPRIVDSSGEFLFVASDKVRSIRMVQDRHVESIRASDFLWLVAPDGYVGSSAAMELGFAVADETPIFGEHLPSDLTLRQYVRKVGSLREAIELTTNLSRRRPESFLIDPHASIEEAHDLLARIDRVSTRPQGEHNSGIANVYRAASKLRDLFTLSA
jgi:hypothetical protein